MRGDKDSIKQPRRRASLLCRSAVSVLGPCARCQRQWMSEAHNETEQIQEANKKFHENHAWQNAAECVREA